MNLYSCFLFLAVAVSVIHAAAVTRSKKCVQGPSYWCSTLANAKECNAVNHCIAEWSKLIEVNPLFGSDSTYCTFCKGFVGDVEAFIRNQKTQSEIKSFGFRACSQIPNEEMRGICNYFVEMFVPEIITMLLNNLNPTRICRIISVCKSSTESFSLPSSYIPSAQLDLTKKSVIDEDCQICQKLVTDLRDNMLKPDFVKEVNDFLKAKICLSVQNVNFQQECNMTIEYGVPYILQSISQMMDPFQICKLLDMCTTNLTEVVDMLTKLSSSLDSIRANTIQYIAQKHAIQKQDSALTCDLCKAGVVDVKSLLVRRYAQLAMEDFFKQQICHRFTGIEKQCNQVLHDYLPALLATISNDLDANTLCKAMGACGTKQDLATSLNRLERDSLVFLPSSATYKEVEESLINAMSAQEQSYQVVLEPHNVKTLEKQFFPVVCVMCEYVMHEVDSMIINNKTKEAVEHALESVCHILPVTVSKECNAFIEKYGDVIVRLLSMGLDPKIVCTTLGLCDLPVKSSIENPATNTKFHKKPVSDVVVPAPKIVGKLGGAECDICKNVVAYVEKYITTNTSEEQIETLLDDGCRLLPGSYKDECLQIVKQYLPYLLDLLKENLPPAEVCQKLGLCNEATKNSKWNIQITDQPKDDNQDKKPILIGGNKCTWGPSFWCAHIENAHLCGALEHCQQKVWKAAVPFL